MIEPFSLYSIDLSSQTWGRSDVLIVTEIIPLPRDFQCRKTEAKRVYDI